MIEQKLLIGRYIELNTPVPVNAGPVAAGFQGLQPTVLHITTSGSSAAPVQAYAPFHGAPLGFQAQHLAQHVGTHVQNQFDRQTTSKTVVGASGKAHRNFIWLEWLPGLVSEVRPNGVDVLTGPMSGCWILSYTRGGIRYVGHVGSDMNAAHANTIASRGFWNAFAAGVHAAARNGFNPFNDYRALTGNVYPAPIPGVENPAPKHFALVTGVDVYHTLIAYCQLAKPQRMRIVDVLQINPTLPANGQI